jgi:hypothetical protein
VSSAAAPPASLSSATGRGANSRAELAQQEAVVRGLSLTPMAPRAWGQPRDQRGRQLRLRARGGQSRHPRRLSDGHQRRPQPHPHGAGAGLAHGGAFGQELEVDGELMPRDTSQSRCDLPQQRPMPRKRDLCAAIQVSTGKYNPALRLDDDRDLSPFYMKSSD